MTWRLSFMELGHAPLVGNKNGAVTYDATNALKNIMTLEFWVVT